MVGVPSALYLAAGLLTVAASAGLAVAVAWGRLSGTPERPPRGDALRIAGVLGALAYATGHVLAGASVGDPQLWAWLQAGGLLALALGAGPTLRTRDAAPLLVPLAPQTPSMVAAAGGALVAARMLGAGRAQLLAALGVATWALAHLAGPSQATLSASLLVVGSLLVGGWLWRIAASRVAAKLIVAFVTALLALAILSSAVLSTVGGAQLTRDELDRLDRLASGLVDDVATWPAEAVNSAQAIAIAPSALLAAQFTAEDSAELYRVGFAEQDFFLVLDGSGAVINRHPQDLGGSLELSVVGDPQVRDLRSGIADGPQVGGLLSTGGRIVAYGAVALRPAGLLPEDPPAGVLITGRLLDVVWAEQQAAALDIGIVGVVGDTAAFTSATVGTDGEAVVDGLDGRERADLSGEGLTLFAAVEPIVDPQSGVELGAIMATSTPDVIANVERDQTQRLFVVTLLAGLLAVGLAAVVIRRSIQPISELTDVARRVGGGDLSGRASIDSPDEIGVLGETFDEMVGSLQRQQEELTDAAHTESRLRGRLESLTTSMSDGLVASDGGGRVIQFNPAAEAMTGLGARDVLGQPLHQVLGEVIVRGSPDERVPGLEDPRVLRLDEPLTEPIAARLLVHRQDDRRVPVAVTAAPVRSPDGDLIGRVLAFRDITREIEVERMKTEFLANVSHELRTPITPIKGYANVLARREVGPEATQQFAEQILDSTARLERIVAMIVDFAALDSGRVVLERDLVDLPDLVDQTLNEWQAAHPNRVFGSHRNGQLPPVVADPAYLKRVLDELLDNAVKFSPEGDPIDIVATWEGSTVRLSVVDRGIGIDPRAAGHLFADFRQVDGTETRHFGGLGLGLGLVKRILDASDATVEVESDPGVGSTVSVLLPVGGPVPVAPLPEPPIRPDVVPPPPV